MRIALTLAMALLAAGAMAGPEEVYKGMMGDSDLYVGEGQVSPADFGGDLDKAKVSGRERARGSMAELIRVKIKSEVSDTMKSDGTQNVEAKSRSVAEVELENIQYKYLNDYPKPGLLTTLAYISKEEYQRQMDRRVLSFRPNRALRLYGGNMINYELEQDGARYASLPAGAFISGPPSQNSSGGFFGVGFEFFLKSWYFGLSQASGQKSPFAWDPTLNQGAGGYAERTRPHQQYKASVGYEYTPWATRLQVAFPVQLEYGLLTWEPYVAHAFGLGAGMNLRYWAADRIAFDIGFRWHQGLVSGQIAEMDGKPFYYRKAAAGVKEEFGYFSVSGPDLVAGIMWNGF